MMGIDAFHGKSRSTTSGAGRPALSHGNQEGFNLTCRRDSEGRTSCQVTLPEGGQTCREDRHYRGG